MNLPRTSRYRITGQFSTGGVENDACTCDNCGRLIVEVAELADDAGHAFRVGMDCAETLVSDFFQLEEARAFFTARKTFAAKLRKARKVAPAATLSVHEYGAGSGFYKAGGFVVTFGAVDSPGYFSAHFPEHYRQAIFPLLK